MKVHPKQIMGLFGTLYDQLRSLDLDMVEVDIEYQFDASGNVVTETVIDISSPTRQTIKIVEFEYLPDGSVGSETVTKGVERYIKTFVYDDWGNVTAVRIRKG